MDRWESLHASVLKDTTNFTDDEKKANDRQNIIRSKEVLESVEININEFAATHHMNDPPSFTNCAIVNLAGISMCRSKVVTDKDISLMKEWTHNRTPVPDNNDAPIQIVETKITKGNTNSIYWRLNAEGYPMQIHHQAVPEKFLLKREDFRHFDMAESHCNTIRNVLGQSRSTMSNETIQNQWIRGDLIPMPKGGKWKNNAKLTRKYVMKRIDKLKLDPNDEINGLFVTESGDGNNSVTHISIAYVKNSSLLSIDWQQSSPKIKTPVAQPTIHCAISNGGAIQPFVCHTFFYL